MGNKGDQFVNAISELIALTMERREQEYRDEYLDAQIESYERAISEMYNEAFGNPK